MELAENQLYEKRIQQKNTPAVYAEHKMYSIYGIWAAEKVGSFDNRIINADAPSYAAQDWLTIARNAAEQNIRYIIKLLKMLEEVLPH